ELARKGMGFVRDHVQKTLGLPRDEFALLRGIAGAEETQKELPRVALDRQRGRRCTERERPGIAAPVPALAGAADAVSLRSRDFQRRIPRVLADVPGCNLVDGHRHVRLEPFL